MPDTNNPANKYTLKEWVKHPTTIMLIIAVNVIWITVFIIVKMGQNQTDDCVEQVTYLRERVDKLEHQVDGYTTAILYKDGQIKMRDNVIDSLKKQNTQGGFK